MQYPVDLKRLVIFRNDGEFGRPGLWTITDKGQEPVGATDPIEVWYYVDVLPEDFDFSTGRPVKDGFDLVDDEYRVTYRSEPHTAEVLHNRVLQESIQERILSAHEYRLAANRIASMTPTELTAELAADPELHATIIIMQIKAGLFSADIQGIDTGIPDA